MIPYHESLYLPSLCQCTSVHILKDFITGRFFQRLLRHVVKVSYFRFSVHFKLVK